MSTAPGTPEHDDGHAHPHDDEHGHAGDNGHGRSHAPEHGHGGVKGLLTSIFRPHSHDSADSVDSALEASADGVRALKISLVALLVTALLQATVVLYTGSVALLADTIHNFSDALTAVPLWFAFVLGRRVATRRYTYGFGRAEDLAGVFIIVMIALSAAVAGYESVRRLLDPQPIENIGVLIAAGLIGAAGNELVALYRVRVGRRIGSAALVADGLHARTDAFTSLAVVLGALGVWAGFPVADPLIGLAITVAILLVLKRAATDIGRRLMDAVDPALVDTAESSLSAVTGVERVDGVRLRWVGHRMRAEADVSVSGDLTVGQGHEVAVAAHHALLHDLPKLFDATVHVSPVGDTGSSRRPLSHHR
ncbi:MAG: cation diffusion facilitator family transporter [Candidatus Nanopelagicales bacterium]